MSQKIEVKEIERYPCSIALKLGRSFSCRGVLNAFFYSADRKPIEGDLLSAMHVTDDDNSSTRRVRLRTSNESLSASPEPVDLKGQPTLK